MNKTEFINELAKRTDRPVTEMYKFVNDFFTLTTEILAREEDILFLGFGRFSPRKQPQDRCSGYVLRAHNGRL